MAKNTYGTGSFVLLNTGESGVTSENGLLTTLAWQLEGEPVIYALEGSIFVAGAAVQWLRDGLADHQGRGGGRGAGGQRRKRGRRVSGPRLCGTGRAALGRLRTRHAGRHDARHDARAHRPRRAQRDCPANAKTCWTPCARIRASTLSALRVDGGAAQNNLLMQIPGGLLGVPVQRPAVTETTALGAAYLAGLAVGFWPDVRSLADQWTIERTFEPRMAADERDALIAGWQRAVERAKGWAV